MSSVLFDFNNIYQSHHLRPLHLSSYRVQQKETKTAIKPRVEKTRSQISTKNNRVTQKNRIYTQLKIKNAQLENEKLAFFLICSMYDKTINIATKRYAHASSAGKVSNKKFRSLNMINLYTGMILLQKSFLLQF